ncbi:origin recognition complex subunit 5 C-terminus-domain-containing protein [Scheffersomyces xylosifermentans]|uniref:origin recognition complex subunit 5 C-terminus-domain-containing protein n=1 Tax=Scheffersomyces xylosifermentans TaxID=1304137 RepID=UPI00315D3C7A
MVLSENQTNALKTSILCRDTEIDLLNAFVSENAEVSAPAIVVHGYKSNGKTFIVNRFLETLGVKKTVIKCDECITRKILLQRCLRGIASDTGIPNAIQSINDTGRLKQGSLGESLYSFLTTLDSFFKENNYKDRHVLVLDRFDQCIESTDEIYGGFIRLQEQTKIRNLSIIFITSSDDPKEIITTSVPHIYFRSYEEHEVIQILQMNRLCSFGDPEFDDNPASEEFWMRYAKMIVDLYFVYTGSDMNLLINICFKLWDRFVEKVIDRTYDLTEFVRVYRHNSSLLEDENIINNSRVKTVGDFEVDKSAGSAGVDDLPVHSKYVLIASYLASFNSQKDDMHNFSKIKAVKYKKRATTSAKRSHLTKGDIDSRLLSPNYFDLERLLAILSVIYRTNATSLNTMDTEEILNFHDDPAIREEKKEIERTKFTLSRNTDLYSQIATLFSLGLISKSASSDILGARVRWRCNVSWTKIQSIAKDLQFPIIDYLQKE